MFCWDRDVEVAHRCVNHLRREFLFGCRRLVLILGFEQRFFVCKFLGQIICVDGQCADGFQLVDHTDGDCSKCGGGNANADQEFDLGFVHVFDLLF